MNPEITRRNISRGIAGAQTASQIANVSGTGTDRYVVGLKWWADVEIDSWAANLDREMSLGEIGRVAVGEFTPEAVEHLRQRDDVRYVEQDGTARALDPVTESTEADPRQLPWGTDRIERDEASIAIVDTGIDPAHEELTDHIIGGEALVTCGDGDEAWADDNEHGTRCAGVAEALYSNIVGIPAGSGLYAVKVLDSSGTGSFADVADGIRHATDRGVDVINLSLGGAYTQVMEDACQYAVDNGVWVVASGTSESDEEAYPGAFETTVSLEGESDEFTDVGGPEVGVGKSGASSY